jgi:hypothetical protein
VSEERKLGKKQERVHVYVATPAYDGKVEVNYAQSLAESAFTCPLYQVYFAAAVVSNAIFIDLARNLYVKWFLEDKLGEGYTHLFFIDADLKWESRAFIGLARSGLPICAGAYRKRQDVEEYPVGLWKHAELGGLWVEDGWVQATRVATGFLCISRKVLEEMSADAPKIEIAGEEGMVPRLFYTKIDDQNRFVGEDFCFCDDYVKKYNKPIPVWPNIDFIHGKYAGNFHEFLERKIKAGEDDGTELSDAPVSSVA